ncbi:hypothetical protein BT93_D1472 [Corymbia citriodora subsp. variegata]|nr:hypothetical protein BT93_D1472 [Corymbia citriodora subsp. variegata]
MALVKPLLVHLFLCRVHGFWGEATSISEEELVEIEARLKILSKPAIKTFVTKEGDTIDCVPIHKQPAFDHPLLKDHKIELEPNLSLFEKDRTPTNAKSANVKLREPCPDGTVSQQLNGDTISRLFTFWTGDGSRNGCYNVQCPGFVQRDREVTTNYPFYDTSIIGRKRSELWVHIEQNLYSGNWWLIRKDDPPVKVGYWPKERFDYLRNGSLHAAWGGIAQEGSDGYYPPMGSGRFPDNDHSHAAYFRNMYWVYRYTAQFPPSDKIEEAVDKPNLYGLKNDGYLKDMESTISYGGPGGYYRAQ